MMLCPNRSWHFSDATGTTGIPEGCLGTVDEFSRCTGCGTIRIPSLEIRNGAAFIEWLDLYMPGPWRAAGDGVDDVWGRTLVYYSSEIGHGPIEALPLLHEVLLGLRRQLEVAVAGRREAEKRSEAQERILGQLVFTYLLDGEKQ